MPRFVVTQELFDALKNGSQQAFLSIYEGYRDAIYIASYNMLKVEEEAEDVTMKAFFCLWNERDELNDPGHLRNYLFLVSRNACLDILRSNQRRHAFHNEYQKTAIQGAATHHHYRGHDGAHEKEKAQAELLAKVFQAIRHLPEKTREVFIMRYYMGKSADEVADMMGVSIRTVYNQSQDAAKSLRKHLTPHWPEVSFLFISVLLSSF
jgi:RNA polymerase sigma-70 factor (ECF subfamily)